MTVRFAGLDSALVAGFRLDVPKRRPRTASPAFQREWDKLDKIRKRMELSQGAVAEKAGFKRAAWFEYRKKGSIPFNLFERVAEVLEAKLQLRVITEMSEGAATSGETQEGTTLDYGKRLARLFEDIPDEHLEAAFGAAFTAARTAIRELPFVEPSAEHKKASRGRSK